MAQKYIQRFIDRHGKTRTYFRRGALRVPLPSVGSTAFNTAYSNALAASQGIPAPKQRRTRVTRNREFRDRIEAWRYGPPVGVYLLLLKGELVYVGTSRTMPERVADHRKNGREFDQVFYIETKEGERRALETLLIQRMRPTKNRAGKIRKLHLVTV